MILAITNTKGGVGKTTTAANLASGFAERERRTLLVDLDPQAHATAYFLEDAPERDLGDFIMDRPSQSARSIVETHHPYLDVVPATSKLTQTAELLYTRIRREERLRRALEPLVGLYNQIVIDCPPALGVLTYNAIRAADLLLIPVQPGVGAVNGINALIDAARELGEDDDVQYRILITMFDVRTTRTNAIFEELMEEHRRRLLRTIVHKSESINQANLAATPVTQFMMTSRGSFDYEALCDEILRLRIRNRSS